MNLELVGYDGPDKAGEVIGRFRTLESGRAALEAAAEELNGGEARWDKLCLFSTDACWGRFVRDINDRAQMVEIHA